MSTETKDSRADEVTRLCDQLMAVVPTYADNIKELKNAILTYLAITTPVVGGVRTLTVKRKTAPSASSSSSSARLLPIVVRLATIGDGVEVKESTIPHTGNGLFATRAFQKDEYITEYAGRRRDAKDAKHMPGSHIRSLVSQVYAIDGAYDEEGNTIDNPQRTRQGKGGGAFANDAMGPRNNARYTHLDGPLFRGAETPNERIVLLQATRNIAAGEEIFVAYGIDYWIAHASHPLSANLSTSSQKWNLYLVRLPSSSYDQGLSVARTIQKEGGPFLQLDEPLSYFNPDTQTYQAVINVKQQDDLSLRRFVSSHSNRFELQPLPIDAMADDEV